MLKRKRTGSGNASIGKCRAYLIMGVSSRHELKKYMKTGLLEEGKLTKKQVRVYAREELKRRG